MGNPFYVPDNPAKSSSGGSDRHSGRYAPVLMLLICGAWIVLSSAAILLTLSDAMPANDRSGAIIAELE
jgi:hypothetical protein